MKNCYTNIYDRQVRATPSPAFNAAARGDRSHVQPLASRQPEMDESYVAHKSNFVCRNVMLKNTFESMHAIIKKKKKFKLTWTTMAGSSARQVEKFSMR